MSFLPQFAHLEKRLKRHVSGPVHTFRVFAHLGFEGVLANELSKLKLNPTMSFPGGLLLNAKITDAWKICAFSRTARKIDMEIAHFKSENFGRLKKEFENIPWELYLPTDSFPEIKVKTKKSRLYHSDAISERLKDYLLDYGFVSNENQSNQKIRLEFENDSCRVYVDIGGDSLYRRGFGKLVESAPVQDSLAASILLTAGIENASGLIDPMCGSGTFSLETAQMLKNIYPGISRHFAFENQPAFKSDAYNHLKSKETSSMRQKDFSIWTSDIHEKCVLTTKKNAELSNTQDLIFPQKKDFLDETILHKPGSLLVLNPPYGIRLASNTKKLYQEIGKKIRSDYRNCKVALLCPNHEALQAFCPGVVSAIRTNHGGLNIFVVFAEARKL